MQAPRGTRPSRSAVRAEASCKNGAKSRGPRTDDGKPRSAQNALRHGMRAEKHVVLPEEDAAEFADLEGRWSRAGAGRRAPLRGDLGGRPSEPGAQAMRARRVAIAAWRLAWADRIEAELFAERRFADGGLGLALIRGPRV